MKPYDVGRAIGAMMLQVLNEERAKKAATGTDSLAKALEGLTATLSAEKSLVFNAAGQPIGIKSGS